ncbi:MAG TPA: helix-turn-helix transcriptional regulator [Limnochordia bacterium]|nr:helix-turn-helix transcriptional regulator [Limnochordia bacterium]
MIPVRIRERDLQAVERLWRELADAPAAQADAALAHCLRQLARWVGAGGAFWLATRRDLGLGAGDPLHGWRPITIEILNAPEERKRQAQRLMHRFRRARFDPQSEAMTAYAGRTRALLRPALVDDATWQRSWLYQEFLRPARVEDRLMGVVAVGTHTESYIGLDRGPRDKPFGDYERDLLQLFLSGSYPFHREQLLVRGITDASKRLSPREQEVLRLLLTDCSEPEIGEALGLAVGTTHQYVVSILRKFGVSGRPGIMAHWLRHGSPSTDLHRNPAHETPTHP